jgi:hypothetical protein
MTSSTCRKASLASVFFFFISCLCPQSDLREEKIPKMDRGRLDVIQAGHRTQEEYIACFGLPRIIVPSECGE